MSVANLNEITKKTTEAQSGKKRVGICAGASCLSAGAEGLLTCFQKNVREKNLTDKVDVRPVGCLGACNQGPLVSITPEDVILQKISATDVPSILEEMEGNALSENRLLFAERGTSASATRHDFFKKQKKVVLDTCGKIDPEKIEDYIAAGGYQSLKKALTVLSREEVIAEIKQSGLRGRGGAGFPAGLKWEMVYKHLSPIKYVVCNGDEGDPGAFMDRSILEGDPHRVLEGLAIAGYAIGAEKGYLYVRAEYPLAIKRFERAIKQAWRYDLIGKNIFGSEFNFDVEIRIGAGAFVCGEETALMASIEGKRGTPRPRPPWPAEEGLWGKPTLINNVETFANIAPILTNGGEWFTQIGTAKSPGTKVFALAGKINNTGLIEVPMGLTLREIIFEIGGGIPDGKKFKAAQTGGPSGGCIPEAHLDTPVDYESLVGLGSIMGSGGLIVMDETSCMVDVARFFMEFCMDESCGKCVPCRNGTKHMHDLLEKITTGQATQRDLDLLEELAPYVRDTSLCGLGITAPNPLMSTLRYFRHEYTAHIEDKICPAGVCRLSPATLAQEVS